jgi:hypothetical protein
VNCPADAKQPANTACTADTNVCTLDVCDGVGEPARTRRQRGHALPRGRGRVRPGRDLRRLEHACPADAKAAVDHAVPCVGGRLRHAENCTGSSTTARRRVPAELDRVPQLGGRLRRGRELHGLVAELPGDGVRAVEHGVPQRRRRLRPGRELHGQRCGVSGGRVQAVEHRLPLGGRRVRHRRAVHGLGRACPADMVSPDTDSDTVCDAIDDCPTVPDPGQADSDNDGDGDACDICTNTLPSYADRGKVTIGKLVTPPGDDTAKIKGRCIPFQETPTVDPMTNGVRLVIQDKNDDTVADWTIPGGAYSTVTKAGWKVHTFPTGMTAQYKNAGTVVPLINGMKKVKFVMKSGQGITKFSSVARTACIRSRRPRAGEGHVHRRSADRRDGSVLRDALPRSGADRDRAAPSLERLDAPLQVTSGSMSGEL